MVPSLSVKASDSSIEGLDARAESGYLLPRLADPLPHLYSLPEKATDVKTLWFGPLVGLALLSGAAAEEAKKPAPLYTNEDLERLSPFRGQTGVLSEPAAAAPRATAPARDGRQDEAYWRREAARVRERIASLRERADEIRRELREARDAARPSAWTSGRSRDPKPPSLAPREARLAAIESRMGELEADLEDRARRARALPGWLR